LLIVYSADPEAQLSSGNFLWLSAVGPPNFTGDLQTWIRNDNLAPDWERIGTDVTGQGPFNASFSLTGVAVPGPIAGAGLPGLIGWLWRVRLVATAAEQESECRWTGLKILRSLERCSFLAACL
jgi:hypothetical protein